MGRIFGVFFGLCLAASLYAQQPYIRIKADDKERELPSVERKGINYVSARRLAEALGSNVYYSSHNSKLEMKFPDYILKITGQNQFLVLSSRKGKNSRTIQLPISALRVEDDVLLPLNYSLSAVSMASGKSLSFEKIADKQTAAPEEHADINPVEFRSRTDKARDNARTIAEKPVSGKVNSDKAAAEKTADAEKTAAADKTATAAAKTSDAGKTPSSASPLPAVTNTAGKTEAKTAESVKKPANDKEVSQFDIYDINTDVKANGTLVSLLSKKKFPKFNSTISDGVLYLNLLGVTADEKIAESFKPKGYVTRVGVKNIGKNSRIEIHLKDGYTSAETFQDSKGRTLMVSIRNSNAELPEIESNKDRWKLNTVVIDAGHGGKDPGAIGVGGEKEKDINLAIALKLGSIIKEHMSNVKVVYTRSTDTFVELYKRGKIANESNGKLFISIHCNSMPKKPSNRSGFEIYLLRPGRTSEAISIAERENSVIKYEDNPQLYRKLNDENFILVSMAHSSYMRYSEQFSDILNSKFRDNLTLQSNGVKQAGFYVLVGASMPGVLIETGFLSNKKDAEYLSSKSGQTAIATSIFSAVKSFKEEYDKQIARK